MQWSASSAGQTLTDCTARLLVGLVFGTYFRSARPPLMQATTAGVPDTPLPEGTEGGAPAGVCQWEGGGGVQLQCPIGEVVCGGSKSRGGQLWNGDGEYCCNWITWVCIQADTNMTSHDCISVLA